MKRLLFLVGIVLLVGGMAFAAESDSDAHTVTIDIDEIAELDLSNTDAMVYTVEAAAATPAGLSPVITPSGGSNDKRLFYTSVVDAGMERKITVALSVDVPAGLQLTLVATTPAGGAEGDTGTAQTLASPLSTTAQDLITGIESGYTGRTAGVDGSGLTYTLTLSSIAALHSDSDNAPVVTYTLTDQFTP